jgi:hypothetical protein
MNKANHLFIGKIFREAKDLLVIVYLIIKILTELGLV